MRRTLGPWADPRVTDTKMLLNLARLDGGAAVGVLANPNLTEDDVTQVLELAVLSHKNVEGAVSAVLASARTTDQLCAIVEAAVKRSAPAARQLLHGGTPQLALRVLTSTKGQNSKAARFLRAAVLDGVRAELWPRDEASVIFDLYLEALPYLGADEHRAGAEGLDFSRAYQVLAGAASGADQLLQLATTFDLVERHAAEQQHETAVIQALLIATIGYPDIPGHWAALHPFGRKIAEADCRDTFRNKTDTQLAQTLARNAAITGRRFASLVALLAMKDPEATDAGGVLEALNKRMHTVPAEVRRMLWEHTAHINQHMLPYGAAQQAFVQLYQGHATYNEVPQPPTGLQDPEQFEGLAAQVGPSAGFVVRRWTEDGLVRATYDGILRQLTTAEHWVTYDALCDEVETMLDALHIVAAGDTTTAETAPRYEGLFGNPLGNLD
jgi:hypothetical protein